MAYPFMSSPPIGQRVALGTDTKFPPEDAIVPFPEGLARDRYADWFMSGKCGLFSKSLSEGYLHTRTDLYHDDDGRVIFAALRLDRPGGGKQVLPLRSAKLIGQNPNFEIKAIQAPTPLFALPRLAASPDIPVIVVEGEKAGEAGQTLFPDLAVTTWPGGAPAVEKADWRPLIGRDVFIWPDHDDAGLDAAAKLGPLLKEIGASRVRVVVIPADFPKKWDLADPIPDAHVDEEPAVLRRLLSTAVSVETFLASRPKSRSGPPKTEAPQPAASSDIAFGIAAVTFLLDGKHLSITEYIQWFQLAAALKHSYGEEGFAAFLQFSERDENFESEERCRREWDGIKEPADGRPRTIATYIDLALKAGWVPPRHQKPAGKGNDGGEEACGVGKGGRSGRPDAASVVCDLCKEAGDEFWVDQRGKCHVTYVASLPNGREVARHAQVNSEAYRSLLAYRYHEAEITKVLTKDQASLAIALMEFKAAESGIQHNAALRVGEHDGRTYVDLGRTDGGAVEIDAVGWRCVDEAPVRFVRGTRGELPAPAEGASLADFQRHFNLAPDDLLRLLGFLIGAFNTTGSYCILLTNGEQGSGKSTLNDKAVSLIDPPRQPKGARMSFNPKEQDMHIAAQGVHVPYFDNVSSLSVDAADALCRMSTGGGSGARTLYTDTGYTEVSVIRPIIVTSIGAPTSRPDLLSRSVQITAQPLTGQRRTERAILRAFEADRPKLIGFLFTCISAALRNRDAVEEAVERGEIDLPRMADFAEFVEGAHESLGLALGDFSRLIDAGQSSMQTEAVLGDPAGAGLVAYFSKAQSVPLDASARDLLAMLRDHVARDAKLPVASAFSRTLSRLSVGLRELGIEWSASAAKGHENVQKYRIWKTELFQPVEDRAYASEDDSGGVF